MTDPRTEKLARLLVDYSVGVKTGDRVLLTGALVTAPLMREIYRQVIRAGGHPLTNWRDEQMTEIMYREGSDEQLKHVPAPIKQIIETYDCQIGLMGANNTRTLSGVEPDRQRLASRAMAELNKIHMRRSAAGELRWVGAMFPTQAYAQEADMSLAEYEDFVYGACLVDEADPVAAWRAVEARQDRLVSWLKGKREVRVEGPNAELSLSIRGRTFINACGQRNMPDGEIFTSPIEDSVDGWVRFSYPAITGGREVTGIELRFEDGCVVSASAEKNEDFLLAMLDTDPGARYLGEFAIGTNNGIKQFTKSILFDEKIGGTIHMAIGRGFPEAGSQNESSVHWDMISDMRDDGKIWVDDELFYDSGRFVIEGE
jgi:aminopeptidase